MSKLRIVKDRKLTNGHESDLRGLGEDKSLLNEVVPLPVLSLKTSETGKEEVESLCKSFSFSVNLSYESGVLHITPANPLERFKEDLVDLFGLMLVIESKVIPENQHAQLWLWDRMRERVRGNGKDVAFNMIKSYKSILKNTEAKSSSLHDGVSIHLRQAGFQVPRNTECTQLTKRMLSDNLHLLLNKTSEQKFFKAGGES